MLYFIDDGRAIDDEHAVVGEQAIDALLHRLCTRC